MCELRIFSQIWSHSYDVADPRLINLLTKRFELDIFDLDYSEMASKTIR